VPVTIILLFAIFIAASVGISTVLPVSGLLAALCVVVIGATALYLSIYDAPDRMAEAIIILDAVLVLGWICFAVLALVARLAQKAPDDAE
jgi:hypothetical protein